MRASPVEDIRQLVPIGYIFILNLFHRSTRDNHAVILMMAHLLEISVECAHVLHRRVLRGVALDLHQRQFDLKRRVGKQTNQVGFRSNLQGHQVQYGNAQRTNILRSRPEVIHHEYILFLQQIYCRQCFGYIKRHGSFAFCGRKVSAFSAYFVIFALKF